MLSCVIVKEVIFNFFGHRALIYGQPSAVYVSVGTLLLYTQQTINPRRKWQHKCSYIGMIGLL